MLYFIIVFYIINLNHSFDPESIFLYLKLKKIDESLTTKMINNIFICNKNIIKDKVIPLF